MGQGKGQATKPLSKAEYQAACKVIPVAELTRSPDRHKNAKVEVTGEVVVLEQSTNDAGKPQVHLVPSVEDPAKTLPSGLLPVHVLYEQETGFFIKDIVTVHGDFRGTRATKLRGLQEQTLPLVVARYLVKVPKK